MNQSTLIVAGGSGVPLSTALLCPRTDSGSILHKSRHQLTSLAPPLLKSETPITMSSVDTPASYQVSSPLPALAPSADGERPQSLSSAWFTSLPSCNISLEEGHWRTCFQQESASETRKFCLVPDVSVCWVEDPLRGAHFFFWPHVQSTTIPHFQPSGADMARAF